MKHFLILAIGALLCFTGAQAQSYNAKIGDTTIHGVATPSYTLVVTGIKQVVTFQYAITKDSGTVAGTIVLSGSIDNGNTWAQLNSYTLTDATAATAIAYNYAAYSKYKITITTSSGLVANFKIWALYRG